MVEQQSSGESATRVIALEEHFSLPELVAATSGSEWTRRIRELGASALRLGSSVPEKLADLGEGRLAAMDGAGIDVQVLSHTQPGVEELEAAQAVELASLANDALAAVVAAHPDRFAGLALIPTPDPPAAARELERAVRTLHLRGALVNGRSRGLFLDHQDFWPIFEAAEALGVPIYLHPGVPPAEVRQSCYSDLPPALSHWLSIAAWGWHVETGLHALRLIAAGVFDRFPRLQVIIGHMGEAVPFMLERTTLSLPPRVSGLQREFRDYFTENFWVTTSGFFSYPPLLCLLLTLGIDRVLFAVDYPYSANEEGRRFLDLLPLGAADRAKLTHLNAERLLAL